MNTLVALPIISAAPTAAPAMPGGDPIFAAIAAHEIAWVAMHAKFAEAARADAVADIVVGPLTISVPVAMAPGETVDASSWVHIEQALPKETHPEEHMHYRQILGKRQSDRRAVIESIIGDENEFIAEACDDHRTAFADFEETTPTTLAGLLAMIVHAGKVQESDPEAFDQGSALLSNMAAAAERIRVSSLT